MYNCNSLPSVHWHVSDPTIHHVLTKQTGNSAPHLMEPKDIQQEVKDILTQYLVQNGMRRTPERYAVLRTVYEQKAPFTVDEIYEQMDSAYHVSRVTIYSSINLFLKLGLVIRHQSSTVERYQTCHGTRDHFLQICTHCGRVSEFRAQTVSNALSTTHFTRFRAEHVSICVYGICSKCQSKLTRQQKKYQREHGIK